MEVLIPQVMLYTHLMVKKKSELENNEKQEQNSQNMSTEENIIVDKIQDTLSRDKEDEMQRLRHEIGRIRDEIALTKLKKERLETK